MKKLPFHLTLAGAATLAAFSTLMACGGLSDPTKPASTERVATISGALTGTNVPAGARVAIVWRAGENGGLAVGNDVAVIGGKFTMDLVAPPSSYLVPVEGDMSMGSSSGSSTAPAPRPSTDTPDAPSESSSGWSGSGSSGGSSGNGSFAFANKLAPKDTVSGQITGPLNAAGAGFVVYVDSNGNGKLDVDATTGQTSDEVIGGNRELMLAYLDGGGALDLEKLRDRSGVAPQTGYNLLWEQERWLPLNLVELKITATHARLPYRLCGGGGDDVAVSSSSSSSGGPGSTGIPETQPNLQCDPDGRGYCLYESFEPTVPPTAPTPPGLCSVVDLEDAPDIGGGGGGCVRLNDNEPIPADWPCALDGGAGPVDPEPVDAGPPNIDP